ncbi:MAG TPA: LuxR C-terminal-related transcriptional regulator [Candidatus Limnocylindrales bacterium]|nr:LuxR C-terminal-related transcriptional regulator [Candidatus Limnocylindrales bacterium]
MTVTSRQQPIALGNRLRTPSDGAPVPSRFRPSSPLVEAKLHPPAQRPGTVVRARLLDLLEAEPGQPIVSIMAPPGYGKSLLLADWVARVSRPVAWLTLDAEDNDPAVLLTYLAAAFDRIEPIDDSILAAIAAPGDRVLVTAAPRLANELHRWRQPVLIVLDDVHRLVAKRPLDILTALLDHLPPGVRVVLASRSVPDLPFGRFRVRPGLLEVGRAELAFSEPETRELVVAMGRHVSPEGARHLTEATEGWAAGIYLATLGRDEGGLRAGGEGDVTGHDRYIAEFLDAELKAGLGDDDIAFLTRTSILDPIEPDLADAVARLPGAAERLRRLSHAFLLVERVAGGAESYRYHRLLRDYLEDELQRREADSLPALHGAASGWYAAQFRSDEAVRHSLAAGDIHRTAGLVTGVALASVYTGRSATLDGWLRRFDGDAFRSHPTLAVIAAWAHLLGGRATDCDRMADIADRSTFAGLPDDGTASFDSARGMLRAIMCRRGPDDALANAELAAAQEGRGRPWSSNALWLLGATRLLVGNVTGADEAFASVVAEGAIDEPTVMVTLAYRSMIAMERGDWAAAEAFAGRSMAILAGSHYDEIVASVMPYAVAARVALHHGNVARARETLVRAQLVRPLATHAVPWYTVGVLLQLARAHLALSDPAGARSALNEARAVLVWRPDLGVLVGEFGEVRRRVDEAASALSGPSTLTAAELRVLPLLSTHLSFEEIGDRLTISRNTVKSHAMSIYGKLLASSRSQAVDQAVKLGLLEPFPGLMVREPQSTF